MYKLFCVQKYKNIESGEQILGNFQNIPYSIQHDYNFVNSLLKSTCFHYNFKLDVENGITW